MSVSGFLSPCLGRATAIHHPPPAAVEQPRLGYTASCLLLATVTPSVYSKLGMLIPSKRMGRDWGEGSVGEMLAMQA